MTEYTIVYIKILPAIPISLLHIPSSIFQEPRQIRSQFYRKYPWLIVGFTDCQFAGIQVKFQQQSQQKPNNLHCERLARYHTCSRSNFELKISTNVHFELQQSASLFDRKQRRNNIVQARIHPPPLCPLHPVLLAITQAPRVLWSPFLRRTLCITVLNAEAKFQGRIKSICWVTLEVLQFMKNWSTSIFCKSRILSPPFLQNFEHLQHLVLSISSTKFDSWSTFYLRTIDNISVPHWSLSKSKYTFIIRPSYRLLDTSNIP